MPGTAHFHISAKELRELLHMPQETTIVNVMRCDYSADTFTIVVQSPKLPELRLGATPVEILPDTSTWDWKWYEVEQGQSKGPLGYHDVEDFYHEDEPEE